MNVLELKTVNTGWRMHVFKTKGLRRLHHISNKERNAANDSVRKKVAIIVGHQEHLAMVQQCMLHRSGYFGAWSTLRWTGQTE